MSIYWEGRGIFELESPLLVKLHPLFLHLQDAQIEREKQGYNVTGGCTALTVVYMLGKLYVCNAGDSRSVHPSSH